MEWIVSWICLYARRMHIGAFQFLVSLQFDMVDPFDYRFFFVLFLHWFIYHHGWCIKHISPMASITPYSKCILQHTKLFALNLLKSWNIKTKTGWLNKTEMNGRRSIVICGTNQVKWCLSSIVAKYSSAKQYESRWTKLWGKSNTFIQLNILQKLSNRLDRIEKERRYIDIFGLKTYNIAEKWETRHNICIANVQGSSKSVQ